MIEASAASIYKDNEFYQSPESFDGFRSYKERASGKAQDIARNQFITANETSLKFWLWQARMSWQLLCCKRDQDGLSAHAASI